MKLSDDIQFEYDCQDTQELLTLLIVCPEELSIGERADASKHLYVCSSCREDYEGMKLASDMLRANRDYLRDSRVFDSTSTDLPQVDVSEKELAKMRFEAMMERALTRRKRREKRERVARIKSVAKHISAIAACLIAVFGLYLTVSHLTGNGNSTPKLAAMPIETPVKIELITGSGSKIITAGQPIIASSELKTLRINENRQMIINAGTELSIIPHNLGCIVKLVKGEIYTEVEHDGKPFIVETIYGRAVITGTTFNIKANDKQMDLAVTEGTVSFESNKGTVNVTAGHKSLLASNAKPTMPQLCDTRKLTAWATGLEAPQEVATTAYQPEIDLDPAFDSGQIDLEQIDYTSWVEQKLDWFKREFPHIFKLKEALAKEGVDVDHLQLLIKSGDLWRFAYPEETTTQLIAANFGSMIKLASAYNKNAQWLSDNLHISQASLLSANETADLKALESWAKALEDSLDSASQVSAKLLTYSLHASVYLAETRTLAWLAVNNDQIALNEIEKQRAATLLEQEIRVASNCVKQFKQMFASSYSSSACDEDKQRKTLQGVIENVEQIIEIDKKIAEYGTFSK